MPVMSSNRVASGVGLGLAGLGTVTAILLLRHHSLKKRREETDCDGSQQNETTDPVRPLADNEPKMKSRIGNFKISKVMKLVEGIAGDLDMEMEFDWEKAAAGCAQGGHVAENAIDTNDETEWERQVTSEQKTFLSAAKILHDLRGSDTHRKLPHFYVVDRQLSQMESQFSDIGEHVLEFPWREHRDDPISELMKLPFMKLVADENQAQVLPVSQGFAKGLASQSDDVQDKQMAEDERLLGITSTPDRESLESAWRHKAREMHMHGECVQIDTFHKLNNAYNRCRARLTSSGWRTAYRGGSTDVLAHYLLIGTDPSESRYGEAVSGLLDALSRERVLARLDVLRSWGEVSGTTTGLGNG